MKIYIDAEYRCYIDPAVGRTEIETEVFDGRCKALIEGYRYIPTGQTWTRADGVVFTGEMIAPWKDYNALAAAQTGYEEAMTEMHDMQAALELLGVE